MIRLSSVTMELRTYSICGVGISSCEIGSAVYIISQKEVIINFWQVYVCANANNRRMIISFCIKDLTGFKTLKLFKFC